MASSVDPPRIVVVGSTNMDLIAYARRIPDAGETIIGDRFAMGFGGKGANQAVMARLLGADVAMVNCVGDDTYGRMTLDNFNGLGIDTSHVHTVPGASGVAPIWVEPDGTNRIIVIPGANHLLTAEQARAALESDRADVVVGQFEIPQEVTTAAFAAARATGATTVLNPAPGDVVADELLAVTDWIIPNQVELTQVVNVDGTGDRALAQAADRLGCRLVVTLGEAGAALVATDGAVHRFPAPPVDAVDTTGAGDAFVGAFSFGIGSGWEEADAVSLGILCAADSVTRDGTQTSFPRNDRAAGLVETARGGS